MTEVGPGDRQAWRRPALALWVCVIVAGVHALTWAVIDPYGQGPDELAHVAVVDYYAKHARPPASGTAGRFAGEVQALAAGLPFSVDGEPSFSPSQSRLVRGQLDENRSVGLPPSYVVANPPLYYAVAAVPARMTASWGLLDRLLLMRIVSVLLCGLTVALCFAFVRETLPGQPWAWTVGGLAVALQPMLGHMGGSVSPDNALFASAAGLFLGLAHAFGRGLGWRNGAGIGLAALCGCLSKGTMFGLLPGAAVGVLCCAWRQRRSSLRPAVLGAGVGAGVYGLPFGAWLWANTHLFARAASTTSSGFSTKGESLLHSALGLASYAWQVFLPRLPFMGVQFRGDLKPVAPGVPPFPAFPTYPLWQIYVEGFIGRFGYFEYAFPLWVEIAATVVLGTVIVLAAGFVWRATGRLRRARAQMLTFALLALGNFAIITVEGYFYRRGSGGVNFEQTRYLFPLIPLYGLGVTAACRGAGRRGPMVGAVLIVLAGGHALAGVLLALGRFYG